jgi:HK97 family phage portal protein
VSLWAQRGAVVTADQLVGERTAARTSPTTVSAEQALRHSAVWACLRLRADLISQMPVDVFRQVGKVQFEVPKPMVLVKPDGRWPLQDFMALTQFDLDRFGNCASIIRAYDGAMRPAVLEPVPWTSCTVRGRGPHIDEWIIGGAKYGPEAVFHERQYPVAGSPFGLSPLAYAQMSIRGYLSAQEFANAYYSSGGVPLGHLKNTGKVLTGDESRLAKQRYSEAVTNRELFVSGKDWELDLSTATANDAAFIDEQKFSLLDVCRYLGVPGDMIDAETSRGDITYANITQRNLQLLVMNLAAPMKRREDALSDRLVAAPRFVKLNEGALLRMDLASRYATWKLAIEARFMAPSEARALDNREPFTPEQIAEFELLGLNKTPAPAPTNGAPA